MSTALDAVGERVLNAATEIGARVFGSRLASAYAIGSLSHGGFSPDVSDVDLAFILEEPLFAGDAAAIEAIKQETIALGLPVAEKLSIFWGTRGTLAAKAEGGRFPALDRLDLLLHGRLLFGRDTRDGLPSPSHEELVIGAVEFALRVMHTPQEVAQILDPRLLIARGIRLITKRSLFPVRFLYTARTGKIGRVEEAAAHYIENLGASSPLIAAATRWRFETRPLEEEVLPLLSRHLRPLFLELIDDHLTRMERYERGALAAELRVWRDELQRS